jgi:hypothetical protein
MQDDEDGGLEIARQSGDDLAERLDAAGGSADDDDVVGRHEGNCCIFRA